MIIFKVKKILGSLNWLIVLIFLAITSCNQQGDNKILINQKVIYLLVQLDKLPEFPNGYENFKNYINEEIKKIKINESSIFQELQGVVYVDFVITEQGIISDPVVKTLIPLKAQESLIRIIMESPSWVPGEINGIPVSSFQTLPLKF